MEELKASARKIAFCLLFCLIPGAGSDPHSFYSAASEPMKTVEERPVSSAVPSGNAAFILVSKEDMCLQLYSSCSELLFSAPISCGSEYGDKRTKEDERTPEGVFSIRRIEPSSEWTHLNPENGCREKGCYGDWFIRLNTPLSLRIGIHGTNKPEEIGLRTSEGCIRLNNMDIDRLVEMVYVGMPVIITPAAEDIAADTKAL